MILVTKTFLPDLSEYIGYLEKIWESGWITNNGPLVTKLEKDLKSFLGVKHLFFVSNGTIALQVAIKALDLRGEIITTPFSYVATTSSIQWENCKPVFVDIDPDTLCLDPQKIEAAITERSCAIMPVHVYGNPCAIEAIQKIADRYQLKVIYDAAHAFAVRYKESSILSHGDISTLSFHATKLFHTVEGGAIVTNNDILAHRISYLRNFGHNGQESFWGLGVNAKSSELHAAMGLCLLPKVPALIARRKSLSLLYDELLDGCNGVSRPGFSKETEHNYAYYPVLFQNEDSLLRARDLLNARGIQPRRYFYPSLNTLPYVERSVVPLAEDASTRALCLPLYPELNEKDVENICQIIHEALMGSFPLAASMQ